MNTKSKKLAAALLTGIFCIIVFAGLALFFFMFEEMPVFIRLVYGCAFSGLCFGMSCVVTQRVQEIRKGEEDDLDNY